jgi:hypothetical protein
MSFSFVTDFETAFGFASPPEIVEKVWLPKPYT